MMMYTGQAGGVSPSFVEGGLTVIAFGLAIAAPRLGGRWFAAVERGLMGLARRRGWAVAAVGTAAFALRLAILPVCPIPQPFVPDDFSFLLAADTFASGRLTNPTPAMWMHFESFHINMTPTYMSMYFPAQGMVLAAGKVLTGQAWFGLLLVTALMCAAVCWMLQAWIPPGWALLGGCIAVLRLGLFSYWINTYTGGGSIAALGGALVLGAFPRLMRTLRVRDGLLLAVGVVIVAMSRPYEGLLLCLPVAMVLAWWAFFGKGRPAPGLLARRAALPLVLLVAAVGWMAYYDNRVNGSPLTLPYSINRSTYAVAPYWIWQSPRPEPVYRHEAMRAFYVDGELPFAAGFHTASGFVLQTLSKPVRMLQFFAGVVLLAPLMMLRRALLDRRMRFFAGAGVFWIGGLIIQVFLLPNYVAPFTVAIYLFGLQAMRHLRVWRPGGRPCGETLVRLLIVVCVVMAGIRAWARPLGLHLAVWPGTAWNFDWYGPGAYGGERAQVERSLEACKGKQLVLVRYSKSHVPVNEWVYNSHDVDDSSVIWAREMDAASNLELIRFYRDRTVWLVEPDVEPVAIDLYPRQAIEAAMQSDPDGHSGMKAVTGQCNMSTLSPGDSDRGAGR